MIVLVGESGCGKSTVANVLKNEYGYKGIVTYTTRPMREGEVNGVDYFFVQTDTFQELESLGYFAETAKYNDWYYGTPLGECENDRVVVLTPRGLRSLRKRTDLDIFSVYISIPRRDRLIKLLQRGDSIEEAYRRSVSDVGQFDGIEDEVSYIFENRQYLISPHTIANAIHKTYKAKDI